MHRKTARNKVYSEISTRICPIYIYGVIAQRYNVAVVAVCYPNLRFGPIEIECQTREILPYHFIYFCLIQKLLVFGFTIRSQIPTQRGSNGHRHRPHSTCVCHTNIDTNKHIYIYIIYERCLWKVVSRIITMKMVVPVVVVVVVVVLQ